MKLTSKNFNLVKIGTVLAKDPVYEDRKEYIVSNITNKFIIVKYEMNDKFYTKRINAKYFTDKNVDWITEWNIKDKEYENEWNKYFEGCGTENWYYAHGGM